MDADNKSGHPTTPRTKRDDMEPKKNQALLIVDDEGSILDVAQEYFELKGYDVFVAQNGIEALNTLEAEKIDCFFK